MATVGPRKTAKSRAKTKKAGNLSAHSRKQSLDSHDVREWFAADPTACACDPAAQKILREYEHQFRYGTKFPGQYEEDRIRATSEKPIRIATEKRAARSKNVKPATIERSVRQLAEKHIQMQLDNLSREAAAALVADQFTPWWQSLRDHLLSCVPREVADRFADYLTGFLLVQENETPRTTTVWKRNKNKQEAKVTNADWRQMKNLLKKLAEGPCDLASALPASTNPPHRESLKTRLIALMYQELVAIGYSRKKIAERYLRPVWNAIGEGIRDSSLLRTERRSRHRTRQTKSG
jgi:hypothetical protein